MKRASWVACAGALALAFGGWFGRCARGEPLPLPSPDPRVVTNGTIYVMVRQPDGGMIIGGEFVSVDGMERRNLARIRPDGQLDPEWNPGANGAVSSLAVDSDGSVFVAGSLSSVGGVPRKLAKIAGSGVGALDPQWNPAEAYGGIYALAVDSAGGLLVGGTFTRMGGADRRNIARLATSGTGDADPLWNPGADGTVVALAVAQSGRVYVGGSFSTIGNVQRARIARLEGGAAAVDPDWNPSANGIVSTIVVAPDETVFAAGQFSSIGGQTRSRLAKLSATGEGVADPLWNPSPNGAVRALAIHGSSSLLVGGDFYNIADTDQPYVASLSRTGSGWMNYWRPSVNAGGSIRAFLSEADGSSVMGGMFSFVSSVQRLSFARLTSTGNLKPATVDVEAPAQVQSLAQQPDGGVVLGGTFFKVDGQPRRNLARLKVDGAVDVAWRYDMWSPVRDLAVDAAGDVYVASGDLYKISTAADGTAAWQWRVSFTGGDGDVVDVDAAGGVYVGGIFRGIFFTAGRNGLAKVEAATGRLVQEWDARLDDGSYVTGLKATPAGELYVSGKFGRAGGQARARIARLDQAGNADPDWNPGLGPGQVNAFALASDGSVYVGGSFGTIGGVVQRYLARVSPRGEVDMGWAPLVNSQVSRLALGPAGSLYVAGSFNAINGVPQRAIGKLQAAGAGESDPLWVPEIRVNESIDALAVGAGHLLVGGKFISLSGIERDGFAALPLTVPARPTSTNATTATGATVVGQPYTVSVQVAAEAGVPTGRIFVEDGQGQACGPVALVDGSVLCTLTAWAAGGYVVTATYTPDSGAFAPSNATVHHTVNRAATTLVIVEHAPTRTTPAQPVMLTTALAVPSPGAGTPSGPATIGDGVDSCTIAADAAQCSLVLTTRGPRMLTATYAGDANYFDSSAQVEHQVNRLPVAAVASHVVNADSVLSVPTAQGVLAQASDPDGDALTVANAGTLTAAGIGGTVVLGADGSFAYTPPAWVHGIATFDYTISDGFESVSATAMITVNFVNHAPHFTLASSPAWAAGTSGVRTHAGFASVTDFGAPNEAGQHVLAWSLRPLGDPNGVVSNVGIALDGTLSYTLSGRAGSASFGVRLQDDGGIANGGHDTSEEQTFTITVASGLDLSIRINNDSDFVAGGMPVEYEIVVRNAGPNDAVGAKVRDQLPANLVGAVWSCSANSGATCTSAGIGSIDDAVTLPAGASLTYRLIATVVADPEATVEQTVSVVAPDGVPDLDVTNNSATRRNTVGVFFDGFDRQAAPEDAQVR